MADKQDLVRKSAKIAGFTQQNTATLLDGILQSIVEIVSEGEKLQLVGFGSFEVKERKARKGRNPKTGEVIDIPSRKVPVFTAGKTLKEAVK